jgi:hypothetical protein
MTARTLLVRWIGACAVAATLGASLGYVSIAPGPLRVLADVFLVGTFEALALGRMVQTGSWIGATIAGLGLGLVAGIISVIGLGLLLAPFEHTNRDVYIAVVYGLGAGAGGLVAGAIQTPVLRGIQRAGPWLIGNAIGAPFIFPALVLSWFAPENLTVGAPLWLVGLAGGVVYGVVSGLGLRWAIAKQ